jgi:hypothetical protein
MLPRPRTEAIRASAEFLRARPHLWSLVKEEAVKAMTQRAT